MALSKHRRGGKRRPRGRHVTVSVDYDRFSTDEALGTHNTSATLVSPRADRVVGRATNQFFSPTDQEWQVHVAEPEVTAGMWRHDVLRNTVADARKAYEQYEHPLIAACAGVALLRLTRLGELGPEALNEASLWLARAKKTPGGFQVVEEHDEIDRFPDSYIDCWLAESEFLLWEAGLARSRAFWRSLRTLVATSPEPFVVASASVIRAEAALVMAAGIRQPGLFQRIRRPDEWADIARADLDGALDRAFSGSPLRRIETALRSIHAGDFIGARERLKPTAEPVAPGDTAVERFLVAVADAAAATGNRCRDRGIAAAHKHLRMIDDLSGSSPGVRFEVLDALTTLRGLDLETRRRQGVQKARRKAGDQARRQAKRSGHGEAQVEATYTVHDTCLEQLLRLFLADPVSVDQRTWTMIGDRIEEWWRATPENPSIVQMLVGSRGQAVKRLDSAASQEERAVALLASIRAGCEQIEALGFAPFDLEDRIRDFDGLLRRGHPMRRAHIGYIGHACSAVIGAGADGTHGTAILELCVAAWEENLDYAPRLGGGDLSHALENAAIARNLRCRIRLASGDRAGAQEDLTHALQHAQRAVRRDGISPRTSLTFSWLLSLEAFEFGGTRRAEAIRLQAQALRRYRDEFSRGEADLTPGSLEEMTFVVAPEEDAESVDLLLWLAKATVDLTESLLRRLTSATRAASYALDCGRLGDVLEFVASTLGLVAPFIEDAGSGEAGYILWRIQGLTALGAIAAGRLGDWDHALELLEVGAAQRARQQVGLSVVANATQIRNLAQTAGRRLVYLCTHESTGLAVEVLPDRRLHATWLEAMTRDWMVEHRGTITGVEIDPASPSADGDPTPGLVSLRAFRDGSSSERRSSAARSAGDNKTRGGEEAPPERSAVERVVAAAGDILGVVADEVAHVIPLGDAAGLPWQLVFPPGSTVNSSANLISKTLSRSAEGHGQPVVIAAPRPTSYNGLNYPDLAGAAAEATWVAKRCDGTAYVGTEATQTAFEQALASEARFLHIAVHGHFESGTWDGAELLWAAPDNDESPTTCVSDISETHVETVVLASCWGGAIGDVLPDEAMSFPTAFLAAGARRVVSPLWPVEDGIARDVMRKFYVYWLRDNLEPALALAKACADVRDSRTAHNRSGWAAFTITAG